MHVTAILLAAGRGLRFSRKSRGVLKTLVKLNRKPVIIYSLEALSRHPLIKDIIVVVNKDNSGDIIRNIKKYKIGKAISLVKGGRRRQDSVYNGLKALSSRCDTVLIHDAARPFINRDLISSVIKAAGKSGAAVAGVPAKNTIKSVDKFIVRNTLARENLWEIQTPQAFRKKLILEAYKKAGDISVTDDSMLVERLGARVNAVEAYYNNIKVTTPEDLLPAEAIARKWNTG